MDKNPVLQFLQRGSYTFDEGMAVLLTFSNNGGVTNFIQRRRDKKALQMELVKLAHVPRLTPLPGREMPSFLQERPAKEEKPQEKPKAPEQAPSPKKEEPKEEDDVVTYLDLKRHEKYDPDKLPPQLKELWLKNEADYKELQYSHAQMKQANSDAGRAEWRSKVVELRDQIVKRWKLFDEEKERIAAPEPAKETDRVHHQRPQGQVMDRRAQSQRPAQGRGPDQPRIPLQGRDGSRFERTRDRHPRLIIC